MAGVVKRPEEGYERRNHTYLSKSLLNSFIDIRMRGWSKKSKRRKEVLGHFSYEIDDHCDKHEYAEYVDWEECLSVSEEGAFEDAEDSAKVEKDEWHPETPIIILRHLDLMLIIDKL